MTAANPTVTRKPSVLVAAVRAILLGGIAIGVVLALLWSLHTLLPTVLALRAQVASVGSTTAQVATQSADAVSFGSRTVESSNWKVSVGDLEWGQSGAVAAADRLNPLPGENFEWVLLPVAVTSKYAGEASALIDVRLMTDRIAMSHTYKARHHYPTSALLNELDLDAIPAGATREGMVGWMIPSSARDAGTCLIQIRVGGTVTTLPCADE